MNSQNDILKIVTIRFPNQKILIKSLFKKNDSFRAICKDYYDCKIVLDKFAQESNKTYDRQKEYRVLLKEIEDELFKQISA